MKITPEFLSEVKAGKMTLSDRAFFEKYVASLKDGRYRLVIKKEYSSDTVLMHRYYRAVALPILADYFGFDPEDPNDLEEVHSDVMRELCGEVVLGRDGRERVKRAKSADFDTYEFTMYIARLRRWALKEYTLDIPEPDPALSSRIKRKHEESMLKKEN